MIKTKDGAKYALVFCTVRTINGYKGLKLRHPRNRIKNNVSPEQRELDGFLEGLKSSFAKWRIQNANRL